MCSKAYLKRCRVFGAGLTDCWSDILLMKRCSVVFCFVLLCQIDQSNSSLQITQTTFSADRAYDSTSRSSGHHDRSPRKCSTVMTPQPSSAKNRVSIMSPKATKCKVSMSRQTENQRFNFREQANASDEDVRAYSPPRRSKPRRHLGSKSTRT